MIYKENEVYVMFLRARPAPKQTENAENIYIDGFYSQKLLILTSSQINICSTLTSYSNCFIEETHTKCDANSYKFIAHPRSHLCMN